MSTVSTLPPAAMQASRAALSAALAESKNGNGFPDATGGKEASLAGLSADSPGTDAADADIEDGEIQEVDMESQADGIRTVFSDPTNFNVKVRFFCLLNAYVFCH